MIKTWQCGYCTAVLHSSLSSANNFQQPSLTNLTAAPSGAAFSSAEPQLSSKDEEEEELTTEIELKAEQKDKKLTQESNERWKELFLQNHRLSSGGPDNFEVHSSRSRLMMATPQSPTRMFNGLSEDDALYSDAKYAHEINDKMRVPKRIRATGEYSDEDLLLSNQNGMMNSWNYHDKIDMNVPDRIVVLGHEEHLGTRSAPREILLENSILPKDPGFVRVATPPRVITLNDHHFPSASDQNSPNNNRGDYQNDSESPPPYVRADTSGATIGFNPNGTSSRAESDSEAVTTSTSGISKRAVGNYNADTTLVNHREGTPVIGDLTPPEEILYLRRQLAKLNRRVLSIEIDNVQRSQREKIVYCMGLAYFLLKAIFWLNRN